MTGTAHHYGVTVSELAPALAFYRDALGLAETDRLSFDDETFARFVGVEGAVVEIVFLDAGGCSVELLAYEEPPGEDANEGVANNDVGAAHLCLAVEDLDARHEELADEYDFVHPPVTLENGARVAYVNDPDGNVVELLEED